MGCNPSDPAQTQGGCPHSCFFGGGGHSPPVPRDPPLTVPPPQYGMQLYRNYQQAQARLSQPPWIGPTALVSAPPAPSTAPVPWGAPPGPPAATSPLSPSPQRSVSDNALVAMDFSGCTGRVIENPSEVLTAALEEAQAWRVSGGAGGSRERPPPHPLTPIFCFARPEEDDAPLQPAGYLPDLPAQRR